MQDSNIDFNKIMRELQKGLREMAEIFGRFADAIKTDILPILEDYYKGLKNKKKYKVILEIYPNKVYMRDKRNVNYYCRNSC